MTQVRVTSQGGHTLVYDTDDVENISVNQQNHVQEVPGPNPMAVYRELTGFTSLYVHIDFKHGKRALWVKDEELAELPDGGRPLLYDPDGTLGLLSFARDIAPSPYEAARDSAWDAVRADYDEAHTNTATSAYDIEGTQ